jgi:hypothetical protein
MLDSLILVPKMPVTLLEDPIFCTATEDPELAEWTL